jgi:hypothetical protein
LYVSAAIVCAVCPSTIISLTVTPAFVPVYVPVPVSVAVSGVVAVVLSIEAAVALSAVMLLLNKSYTERVDQEDCERDPKLREDIKRK